MLDQIARQPRPLGPDGQKDRRQLERQTRARARALAHWAHRHGTAGDPVARSIGIARQTLRDWNHPPLDHGRGPCLRGSPPRLLTHDCQDQIHDLLEECRGRLGLSAIKGYFPDVPRTTLQGLRDQYRLDHAPSVEQLTWTCPGTVWSADYTLAPAPIDDRYPYVLSIRDMASSCQLLAWPVEHPTAQTTLQALRHLLAVYDPPLVLKTDNGGHFTAPQVTDLLAAFGVTHLLSPPRTPWYNGSQEASLGGLKTRASHLAAAAGRFAFWTCDDLEAARLEANSQGRPFGRYGLTPDQLWQQRVPISPTQRACFLQAVAAHTTIEMQTLIRTPADGPGCRPAHPFGAIQRAMLARRAIHQALVELGLLLCRRTPNLSTHSDPLLPED